MKYLLTLLLLFAINASADGNGLLSDCKHFLSDSPSSANFYAGICTGTITGMRHMNSIYTFSGVKPLSCIPHDATSEQLARVVKKYLEDHPNRLHEHEAYLINDAFIDSFPCN